MVLSSAGFQSTQAIAVHGVDGYTVYTRTVTIYENRLLSLVQNDVVPMHLDHYLLAVMQRLSNTYSFDLNFGLITEHLCNFTLSFLLNK